MFFILIIKIYSLCFLLSKHIKLLDFHFNLTHLNNQTSGNPQLFWFFLFIYMFGYYLNIYSKNFNKDMINYVCCDAKAVAAVTRTLWLQNGQIGVAKLISKCTNIVSWHLLGHAIKSVTYFDLPFSRSTRPMTSFGIFITYIRRRSMFLKLEDYKMRSKQVRLNWPNFIQVKKTPIY